ncbi:MAG TPA: cytochrome P450 [Solirubrobacteraceae bacterium]|nr:cytochrome P450 [Solirubrobacteraceae bacterium]
MRSQLPPGPRTPRALQMLGWWSRPTSFMERCRERYGDRFTIRLLGQPPWVLLSDPEEIKQLMTAPAEVLHPGEGARILEPVVGAHSVILLDEGPHMEQRKLLLPAFHGERMQRLAGLMAQLAEREALSWPRDEPVVLHPRLQRLTLEIILRAVFGLERGAQLDELSAQLTEVLAFSENPLSLLPGVQRALAGRGPVRRLERAGARADELIYGLIDERGREDGEGEDVLSLLLGARHEDGSPMSPTELRDELVTALVAGHETTASQLAWALERLAREPAIQARVRAEIDDEDSDDAYLTATLNEIMRHRPVLPNAEPRLVKQPIEIGGVTYPPGVVLIACVYLVHHNPAVYPDPYAFRPERFLDQATGTYTWIPFGGGRRRCLGASFALLESKIVLRAVLERYELRSAGGRPERARRRGITLSPAQGAQVILTTRDLRPTSRAAASQPLAAPA